MTLTELLPQLKTLTRAENFTAMQFLLTALAQTEELSLKPGATYPIWTPLNSHAAAQQLAQLLEADAPQANG